jgi:hypothetical protein
VALAHLVDRITRSTNTLWAIDFPFALPIELACMGADFSAQLATTLAYPGDAYEFGRWLLAYAKSLGGANHLRRQTDTESKTPFDCYHYRIICQTFHGMRDVLLPLRDGGQADRQIAVLPFDPPGRAKTLVVESCPGSTLRRLGLPHNRYKYTGRGPIPAKLKPNRTRLIDHLCKALEITEGDRRTLQRNPGGDAIDAVFAALGGWHGLAHTDWAAKHADGRARCEGWIAF